MFKEAVKKAIKVNMPGAIVAAAIGLAIVVPAAAETAQTGSFSDRVRATYMQQGHHAAATPGNAGQFQADYAAGSEQ